MRRKFLSLVLLTAMTLSIVGCGYEAMPILEDAEDAGVENTESEAGDVEDVASASESDLTFEDLSSYAFEWSSGAGGWGDGFHILRDGYFYGQYSDSDMGVTGDGYPNGSMYYCNYSGQLSDLTKVDDLTYEMTVSDISFEKTVGEEEIIDGTLYTYTDAPGLPADAKLTLYLPGSAVSNINAEIYESYLMDFGAEEQETTISNPVLVCEEAGSGYRSYESSAVETAENDYTSYQYSYDYYIEAASDASDLGEKLSFATSNARLMNELLNRLWTIYKHSTDSTSFQETLEEQKSWVSDKEAKIKDLEEASSSAEEGQIAAAQADADLTYARCAELVELIRNL